MPPEYKEKIINFMRAQSLMVVSTMSLQGDSPEAAVVGFVETPELELFFGTSRTSRKYANLKENGRTACVIGWDGRVGTIQYEGVAEEIPVDRAKSYIDLLLAKNPRAAAFLDDPDQTYFLIRPQWIRLVDMSQNPQVITETTL